MIVFHRYQVSVSVSYRYRYQYRYRYRYGCLSSIGIGICLNHQPGIGICMNVQSSIGIGMVVSVEHYTTVMFASSNLAKLSSVDITSFPPFTMVTMGLRMSKITSIIRRFIPLFPPATCLVGSSPPCPLTNPSGLCTRDEIGMLL